MRFIFLFLLISSSNVLGQVTTVDFLKELGLTVNAAGPYLLEMDAVRNRLLVANANSSSITVINCADHSVENIPIDGRGYQHLKDESFTHNRITGEVWLLGKNTLFYANPQTGETQSFFTGVQFESIAIDEVLGTAYLSGREHGDLVSVDPVSGKRDAHRWKDFSEPLVNMNQTPPPPIRKVIVDNSLGKLIALDGYSATLSVFSLPDMTLEKERKLNLPAAARWHLGGYNETTHTLYVVLETSARETVKAAAISVVGEDDQIITLPGLRESVGAIYNETLNELYITYDNDPVIHLLDFNDNGKLTEIAIPHYGNDALALAEEENLLFAASWAFGEVEIIDLEARKFVGRISNLGILPHMFTMEYNSKNGTLYFPRGATAVNGVFGASVTAVEVMNNNQFEIATGWAPVELMQAPDDEKFLVFGIEDQLSLVTPDGEKQTIKLPFDYPHIAEASPSGKVYLSYGPHQSYYPQVYIWGAKNGVMLIDPGSMAMNDRRIPRLAQDMCLGDDGVLYLLQNNWGTENLNVLVLEDEVREFTPGRRIIADEKITRETTQREILYLMDRLYVMKAGETESEPGAILVLNTELKKRELHIDTERHAGELVVINTTLKNQEMRIDTELNPVDMLHHKKGLYVANFGSNSVTIVDNSFDTRTIDSIDMPLSLAGTGNIVWALEHSGSITGILINDEIVTYPMPDKCLPNTMEAYGDSIIIAAHSESTFYLYLFDSFNRDFKTLLTYDYPYGDVSFDTDNSAFYLTGQYGDMIFELNKIDRDKSGRLWVTDFLSGKLFIIE